MLPAVVLAAGRSSRMGRVKALLELDGEPLLLHLLAKLRRAGADPCLTVVGFHRDEVVPVLESGGHAWVENAVPEDGQISSLRVGLAALPPGAPGVLLVPVDHGLVAEETIRVVLDAAREDPTRPAVPSVDMRRGHPTWFPRSAFGALMDPALEGGARTVLRSFGEAVRHLVVEDRGARLDVDTPEDWEAATWRRT